MSLSIKTSITNWLRRSTIIWVLVPSCYHESDRDRKIKYLVVVHLMPRDLWSVFKLGVKMHFIHEYFDWWSLSHFFFNNLIVLYYLVNWIIISYHFPTLQSLRMLCEMQTEGKNKNITLSISSIICKISWSWRRSSPCLNKVL